MQPESVVILDFGSQYTQLIARRARELHVLSRVLPCHAPLEKILSYHPKGLILSGGPANVYQNGAPRATPRLFDLGLPVLGICYGHQLMAHAEGGHVLKTHRREFGYAKLHITRRSELFHGLPRRLTCWMSHGDQVKRLPPGFRAIARTSSSRIASMADPARKLYGVQFHPEVVHTPLGKRILSNFLFRVAGFHGDWTPRSFISEAVRRVREEVGQGSVVLGLSGGVDSSVAACLIHRAIGKRLTCIFVDNGLLRLNERERVESLFRRRFRMNLRVVRAEPLFLEALGGVEDPERKRRIIGNLFVRVFERESERLKGITHLAQGTLYPDVIESQSYFGGPSSTIKTHHNVGGLPKRMRLKLLEPLRELFKDEVREVGRLLQLPGDLIGRQPFPGPGLAVRIMGAVTRERCDLLRRADWIVLDEVKKAGLYRKLWQSFAVLLPVKSVGVMGDERTYENVCAVRAVTSQDGMTADWARLPADLLARISNRIINEVRGINRVVYDVSSKPPATIEWE